MRIDLPCCPLKSCRYHFDGNCTDAKHYEDCILMREMVQIPQNATNGYVIKAMFPNIDFTEMAYTVHATTSVTSNGVKGGISYDFWKDWWNAPYKEERSGEK